MGVGLLIKQARARTNVSQVELAEKINTHRTTLSRYENDVIPVSFEILSEIAQALNLKLEIRFVPLDE